MLLRILFFIISIALYISAPNDYDFSFCCWCMVLYLLQVGICIKQEIFQGVYFSFNIVFFFAFFWTSFAYPVFVHGTDLAYFAPIVEHINWSVLSHTTSLCLLFASTYFLGYGSPKMNLYDSTSNFRTSNGKAVRWLKVVFCLLMGLAFMYLVRAGFSYSDFSFDVAYWDLYYVLLALCLIEKSKFKSQDVNIREFIALNKFPVFSALFIIFLFLMFGDRGPALKCILVCSAVYYFYYKKIEFAKIAIIGAVGIALMFFIRQTRATDSLYSAISDKGTVSNVFNLQHGAISMFADFYGIAMELNIAYDYAQHHGLYHPERVLAIPLTTVPFLPSIVLPIFGTSMDNFSTGAELNRQMSAYNSQFGNHVVGDLYMSTGLLGVIIFAFFLGLISKRLAARKLTNQYCAVAYILLFSVALYLPRDTVFAIVRPLALSFILPYLILPKKKRNI